MYYNGDALEIAMWTPLFIARWRHPFIESRESWAQLYSPSISLPLLSMAVGCGAPSQTPQTFFESWFEYIYRVRFWRFACRMRTLYKNMTHMVIEVKNIHDSLKKTLPRRRSLFHVVDALCQQHHWTNIDWLIVIETYREFETREFLNSWKVLIILKFVKIVEWAWFCGAIFLGAIYNWLWLVYEMQLQ